MPKMVERFNQLHVPKVSEAEQALRKQAAIVLKFHLNPEMTIEERTRELNEVMTPLKLAPTTKKYSLEELGKISSAAGNTKLKVLYDYEAYHAEEMKKVLLEMGVETKPEFDVYYCPTVYDNFVPGEVVGLLDMKDSILNLDRSQTLEFDIRLAIKMFKSGRNSLEDFYTVCGILGGNAIGKIRKTFSK
ncbi:MAG TPA: hypothetical protein VMR19_00725 [Candidatus Saccharimonadales bacterium]|nr:hypothetical protein [Candidatus Saccharimonadales bacterium]